MEVKRTKDMLYNIFCKAVEATLEASGLTFDKLATSRDEKSVTARVVLVDVLMTAGMSESMIVELSGMSQQRVNRLKNSARYRLKGLLGKMMRKEVGDALAV